MIELTQRISGEDMTRGLAPKDLGFGSPYATELLNLKPEEEGLVGYEELNDPFDGGVSISWPFPQVFETQEGLVLFQQDSLYEVTESTTPWGISSVTTYDPENPSSTKSIIAGDSWHFASFGPAWYATNGSSLVFRTGLDDLSSGSSPKTFVGDEISIESIAAHKGRVFMGGFSTDLWESTFEQFFAEWKGQLKNLDPSFDEISENWIAYSSIGGGDLPMWLFHPQGYNTDLAPSKERVLRKFQQNEMGFLPLPTNSEVRAIEPLGDNLVAYCEEATFLIQLEFPRSQEVPATVGYRKLLDVGIYSRNSVGGSEFGHTFVDQFGSLWQISADGETQNIGFRNQLEQHLGPDECLVYESGHNDYTYIGFEEAGFLLTEQGMCEITESPTFLFSRGREDKGTTTSHGEYFAQFVGPPTDFADRGLKTVTSVAAGYRGKASVECGVDYRFSPDDVWHRTGDKDVLTTSSGGSRDTDSDAVRTVSASENLQPVNNRGIAYIRQSGGSFRFVVEADDPSKFDLDYVEVRFQLDDARHQRGPRAGETAS